MRGACIFFLAAAATAPAVSSAQNAIVDGSAAAIREVVSGKTCTGEGVLTFGEAGPGSAGTFNRIGRPDATYAVGYGTILIRRGEDLHGHVTSVSMPDRVLHIGADTYRCGLTSTGVENKAK